MTRTTALQARLLGTLRDGRVHSLHELDEQLGEEIEQGALAGDLSLAEAIPEAIGGLVEAGLVHRINEQLVTASRRGLHGEAAPDPGEAGELIVVEPRARQVGVTESLGYGDAVDLRGGAEGLSSGLDEALAAGAKGARRGQPATGRPGGDGESQ